MEMVSRSAVRFPGIHRVMIASLGLRCLPFADKCVERSFTGSSNCPCISQHWWNNLKGTRQGKHHTLWLYCALWNRPMKTIECSAASTREFVSLQLRKPALFLKSSDVVFCGWTWSWEPFGCCLWSEGEKWTRGCCVQIHKLMIWRVVFLFTLHSGLNHRHWTSANVYFESWVD